MFFSAFEAAQELRAFHEQIVRRTENGKAMLKLLQAERKGMVRIFHASHFQI